jgi:two-component system chemotaxis response regulator CheB
MTPVPGDPAPHCMDKRAAPVDIVIIGASAGGVDALMRLFGDLPTTWRLPLVVVLHLPDDRPSLLAEVFRHRLQIPTREAADKEPIRAGTLYFAGAGYHLLVESDHSFSLSCEPPVRWSRPSIDVFFESAALAYGSRLAAFLLTGANQDGAAGLQAVQACGGLTAVQDPAHALADTMPLAALAVMRPDYVMNLQGLKHLLIELERDSRGP